MDKNKLWKWLLLGLLVLWSFTLAVPPFDKYDDEGNLVARGKIKLGLDLRGGSSFVVEVDAQDVAAKMVENERDEDGTPVYGSVDELFGTDGKPRSKLLDQVKHVREIAVEVIRNRIDVLGTAEPATDYAGNPINCVLKYFPEDLHG